MKKFTLLIIFFFLLVNQTIIGQVSIGTNTPDSSAILDLQSFNKGFLLPRMNTLRQKIIKDPATGLLIFNTDSNDIYFFNGDIWLAFRDSSDTIYQWTCNDSLVIDHVAGTVAPITKTVTYGTITNIPGEPSKCWITSNLGADHQATAVWDATEASAGWYWQFDRMQGYKHDGSTVTPAWTITSINENSNWLTANDPCALELGSGWRLPTSTEWTNVDESGGWTNWNGPWNGALKMHTAGCLSDVDGSLDSRGWFGGYWSSSQGNNTIGWAIRFDSGSCYMYNDGKAFGLAARCLRD